MGLFRRTVLAADGGDIDDATVFLPLHVRKRCLNDQKRTLCVDIKHTVPVLFLQVLDITGDQNPGIVYESIDAAEHINHITDHRFYLGFVAHISIDGQSPPACSLDCARHFLQGILLALDVVDSNIEATFGHADCNGAANTPTCTGNEGDFCLFCHFILPKSKRGIAAIHGKHGACHKTCRIGRQKQNGIGDLSRFSQPSLWRHAHPG